MPTAAIYARVSTTEQAERGYSLPAQLDACRSAAKAMGATYIDEYKDEGYSGEFINRPAMDKLRETIKTTSYDAIICYDPDRLARNLAHQLLITEEIEATGAKLKFVSVSFEQSPEGKLFYSIRGAVAEFEKEKIRQRTVSGKKRKALQGKLTFNDKPFGYNYDYSNCNYTIIEAEARIVRLMFHLMLTNKYGVRSLAYELKALDISNRSGKRFSGPVLYKMLTNEMYAGTKWAFKKHYKTIGQRKVTETWRDKTEWIPISVPAIVEPETFTKVQQIIKDNTKYSRRNTKHDYLLRNIIKCADCGYSMIGTKSTSKGKDFFYYVCTSKSEGRQCLNRHIPSQELDTAVWEFILASVKAQKIKFRPSQHPKLNTQAVYQKHYAALKQKQTAILKWLTDGVLDLAAADTELKKIVKELAAITSILEPPKPSVAISASAQNSITADTFAEKRKALLSLGITIFALKDTTGQITFYIKL